MLLDRPDRNALASAWHGATLRLAPLLFRTINDPTWLVGVVAAEAKRRLQPIAIRLSVLAMLATVLTAMGGLLVAHGSARITLSGGDLPVIAAIGLLSAAVGGIFAAGFAHHMSRPIRSVARAAARLAAGDRTSRIEQGGTIGEIRELIDNFNAMAAAIEAFEQERRVRTAGITHELRTPLAILKGRLHGIDDGVLSSVPEEAARLLRQVDHILRIVDDIAALDPTGNDLALAPRAVDIGDILRPTVADVNAVVAAHGVRVVAHYRPATVVADPGRLNQVFTNLLTNAVKHSRSGDVVAIDVAIVGDHVSVSVTDQGPGFDPADADRLFAPLWRAAANIAAGRPGTGMGLSLAARFVAAQGGSIIASNRSDRSGACFSVCLPLADQPVKTAVRAVARPSGVAAAYIAAAPGR